ncbi:MAG: tetratricopeptide repeat protein [Pseudomonadota bacterium]
MTSSDRTNSRISIKDSDRAKAAGRDYYEGITFEEFQAALKDREASVRDDLAKAEAELKRSHELELKVQALEHEKSVNDLRQQLAEYERRVKNPEQAFQEMKLRIGELEKLLEDMSHGIGENRLRSAHEALEKGDFSEAAAIFADVKAQAKEHAAEAAYGEGLIAEQLVRWGEAAERFKEAADLVPNPDRLAKAGTFLWRAGRSGEAVRYEEDLLAIQKREAGEAAPETATALNNLAESYRTLGRFEEAEPLFRQALEIDNATIGEGHPDYARDLNNLALLLKDMDRFEEAEPLFREALETGKATLGEGHPAYAIRLNNLANLLRDMGRFEEAEPLFRQALEIDKATIGEGHPDYATHLNNLAGLLQDMGRFEEAAPLMDQAVEILQERLGPDHPNTKTGIKNRELFRAKWAAARGE